MPNNGLIPFRINHFHTEAVIEATAAVILHGLGESEGNGGPGHLPGLQLADRVRRAALFAFGIDFFRRDPIASGVQLIAEGHSRAVALDQHKALRSQVHVRVNIFGQQMRVAEKLTAMLLRRAEENAFAVGISSRPSR